MNRRFSFITGKLTTINTRLLLVSTEPSYYYFARRNFQLKFLIRKFLVLAFTRTVMLTHRNEIYRYTGKLLLVDSKVHKLQFNIHLINCKQVYSFILCLHTYFLFNTM